MRGTLLQTERVYALLLLNFLLASESRAGTALGHGDSEQAWDHAISLATLWKVTPQLAARLNSIPVELPPPSAYLLRRAVIDTFKSTACGVRGELKQLRPRAHRNPRNGIQRNRSNRATYGSPRERTIRDADLVVAEADVAAALRCLEAINFTRRGNETFDQYVQFMAHSPGFAGNLQ